MKNNKLKRIIRVVMLLLCISLQAQDQKIGQLQVNQVGIGVNPNASLRFGNIIESRKIVLWETATSDMFFGFGINSLPTNASHPTILRFQVPGTDADYVFYSAINPTSSNELMRIKGTGNVGIGTSTPSARLEVTSGTAGTAGLKLTNLPNAILGTDANGNVIDGSVSVNNGVSTTKVLTISALRASLDDVGEFEASTEASQIYFRLRRNSTNDLVLQVRLKTSPAVNVSVYTQSVSYSTGAGVNEGFIALTFTGSNYSIWQTVRTISVNNASTLININTESIDPAFENRYIVVNMTRTNGNAIGSTLKALVVSNYTKRAGD